MPPAWNGGIKKHRSKTHNFNACNKACGTKGNGDPVPSSDLFFSLM